MIDRWDSTEGLNICNYKYDFLCIGYQWLFSKLKRFEFDVFLFNVDKTCLFLRGNYPIDRISEIKRFFYDNYPGIESIVPTKLGIKINFKIYIEITKP